MSSTKWFRAMSTASMLAGLCLIAACQRSQEEKVADDRGEVVEEQQDVATSNQDVSQSEVRDSQALQTELENYTPGATGVSGTVKSIGSDTMNNLMTLWAED